MVPPGIAQRTRLNRRASNRPARRGRNRNKASAGAYALFYCAVVFGVALLTYAGLFLSGPAAQKRLNDNEMRTATIQLDQSDGKGQCRQVIFDNASGRFEEIGMGPCRNLIPDELLVQTVRSRTVQMQGFARAFGR